MKYLKVLPLLLAAAFLLVRPDAYAQSKAYTVQITAVKPDASCSISTNTITLALGSVTIPWSGSASSGLKSVQVDVSYTNTTSIQASINKTSYSWDTGKITASVFVTDNATATTGTGSVTKSVSGSGSAQTASFYIKGTGTVQAGATPGNYSDNTGNFSVSCSN